MFPLFERAIHGSRADGSDKIQLKEKLHIRSEIKSFGGKGKSVKTAPSKGLIGGEKQLNFVEGKPFVCKEKDCRKAFRYNSNLKKRFSDKEFVRLLEN